jgi:hypothetical protein
MAAILCGVLRFFQAAQFRRRIAARGTDALTLNSKFKHVAVGELKKPPVVMDKSM